MKAIATFFGFLWRALDALRKVMHLIVLLVLFLVIAAALSPSIPDRAAQDGARDRAAGRAGRAARRRSVRARDRRGRTANSAPRRWCATWSRRSRPRKTTSASKLLVLDLGGMAGGGVAKLEEVAAAIRDFRASGKKVIAYGEGFDQAQYYLAAQADEIYLDPQGLVLIEGFGYYRTFLKGVIDKLAVDVNVFRAGKFKSYTDQFSRSDMSEQEEEESLAWLNALWTQYQAGVVKARGLDDGRDRRRMRTTSRPLAKQQRGDLAAVALEKRSGHRAQVASRSSKSRSKASSARTRTSTRSRAFAHWDYLRDRALRARAAPRRRSRRRRGCVRRDSRRRASAGHHRLGFDSRAAAPGACMTTRSRPSCCASTARAAACSPPRSSVARSMRCARPASRSSRR